jgi:hypothetical protein
MEAKADVNCIDKGNDSAFTLAIEKNHIACLMLLLDCGGTSAHASTKAHALGAVLKMGMQGYDVQAAAFMLLAHGTDIDAAVLSRGSVGYDVQAASFMLLGHGTDVDFADVGGAVINAKRLRSVPQMYERIHLFIERWHGVAIKTLSSGLEVDRRIGLRLDGLHQEPMELVLQYLGLSMDADQVVNGSLDDDGGVLPTQTQRVLLPNCAHNANHWTQLYQKATEKTMAARSTH